MSLKSILGLGSDKKVRYAVVSLGDISQEAFLPGVAHTGNSVVTALVSGDPGKAKRVAEQYDLPPEAIYGYERFPELIASGKIDAAYIAPPNTRHAEFTVPALRAGIHVLLEKPMEVSVAKCQEILDAQKASGAKLMVAYRLHFEPLTLAVIDLVRSGKLGTVRGFSSTFAQNVTPDNHRAHNGLPDGPIYDMGAYPINAVRNLFGAEPTEAFAYAVRHGDSPLGGLDDTFAVTLKFPGDRLAQFTVSYVGNAIDTYTVFGTAGSVVADPGFTYGKPLAYTLRVGKTESAESFKATDQFGGQTRYFSDCVLNDTTPEPDGEEGLLDVRVIEAVVESVRTGRPVPLPPRDRGRRIDTAQVQKMSAVSPPTLVDVKQPAG